VRKRKQKPPFKRVEKRKVEEVKSEESEGEGEGEGEHASEDDVDEGYLSEGEIFVPKKRPKKEISNEEALQDDTNEDVSLEKKQGEKPLEASSAKKDNRMTTKKSNKVCRLWLQKKCRRGRFCRYRHEKKRISTYETTAEDTAGEQEDKPKSLYAAVHSPLHHRLTGLVIAKSNGEGEYCAIASIIAFPGAGLVAFKIEIPLAPSTTGTTSGLYSIEHGTNEQQRYGVIKLLFATHSKVSYPKQKIHLTILSKTPLLE
jgi:hypothetical protein